MVTNRSPDGVSVVPTDRDHRALRMAEKRARRAQLEAELGCPNGHFQRGVTP
jgi:hypothetical protein